MSYCNQGLKLNDHFIQAIARSHADRLYPHAGSGPRGILGQLEKQGYKVSKLTKNKAGLHGWVASNGDKRFFCRMNVSIAVVSKKELVSITSAGNLVKLNRATFEATLGGPDPSLPLWSDLQAGRVKAPHVKGCTPLR